MQGSYISHIRFIHSSYKVHSISRYGQNNFIFYSFEKLILLHKIHIYISFEREFNK